MKKFFKITIFSGFVVLAISILAWLTVRYIAVEKAQGKAQQGIEKAFSLFPVDTAMNEDEKVIALTRYVFENFRQQNPSEIPLLRLRPYLSNERLPDFLRLPSGVIETHIQAGLCDNAARALAFILKQEGFESVQWNMVSNRSGHSALLVTLSDSRQVFVDPFYGVVALGESGELIHPIQAQEFVKEGRSLDQVLVSLNMSAKKKFYEDFQSMNMGAEGQDLIIESIISSLDGEALVFGEINSEAKDVMIAGSKNNMTAYWHYMGHKYNREWVRILEAKEPVKVVMTLVNDVETNILTTEPVPAIEGKKLIWKLKRGEKITFRDGKAKISLKRMNSFIEVDQIAFYPASVGQ